MDVREKLVELLKSVLPNFRNNMAYWGEKPIYEFADCLLANGVTVQETARRCVDGKPVTNADRIRSMNDDELNELFYDIYNAGVEDAVSYEWGHRTNSFEWTMEWLQQPAEVIE